ncbi:MAG TPA: HAMP domain-containing sensor histidine kinase [Nitrosarchaeum sp.]|nr:HAMP domain-containing sensor histidine kinase [Nitrosarchaeum sp.]
MNSKQKIVLIVGLQIALIVCSYLVLVHLESQRLEIGESINYAGLNRFLTVNTHLEVHESTLEHDITVSPESLEKLKKNLFLIKEGGTMDDHSISPLPLELEDDWRKTYDDYLIFEKNVLTISNTDPKNISDIHTQLDTSSENLVRSSDELVTKLTVFLARTYVTLIQLQIALLLINTFVHILLVFMIFRILNKDMDEKLRLEKFATIGKIGSSIAHDLRNPLTVIKGSIEILKMRKNDMDESFEKTQYKKIYDSINKITYFTNDILDYVRTAELNKEAFNFSEIIQNSLHDITIPNHIEIKLPIHDCKINADKIKLGTVITNLIKNSIDELDKNGTITMNLKETSNHVIFSITDTGNKLLEKDLSKIFEPLYTTKQMGTGLGLASCKRIVELHGGKIAASINPTTFTISLPKQ